MGLKKTCIAYQKVSARSAKGTRTALRCSEFAHKNGPGWKGKHPKCPGQSEGRLQNGGRSPGLIRAKGYPSCTRGSTRATKKKRSSR